MSKPPKALFLFLAVLALLFSSGSSALGAPLRTLIVHADTLIEPAATASIEDMEGMVFNDAANISDALLSATYGLFELTTGPATDPVGNPIKTITVDLTSTNPFNVSATGMEALMMDETTIQDAFDDLSAEADSAPYDYDPSHYDRILICLPFGTHEDGDPFTEYDEVHGYYDANPTAPLRSVYSWYSTGTTFDGIMFALGENFGFDSSAQGANAFGDTTCAMGASHFNLGNFTATYGAVKKFQAGWFSTFPNTTTDLTEDATIDLYPISQNPGTTPGMRMVSIDGTNYRISYRRQFDPYAWLRFSSQADKVYVHSDTGVLGAVSSLESQLDVASATLLGGSTVVTFESHGAGNAYATVSFDLDDGNARPVADSRFIAIRGNSSQGFTLTGSDADGDSLNFTKLTDPAIGSLSGTAPNLVYTPPVDFLGQTSFTFRVDDGKIGAVGTITIDVTEPNIAPVADDLSINAFYQTPEPFTVTGSDSDGDPLTFFVETPPANGVLSGTIPNLIYTPNNNFSGQDTFTFKVNDFYDDSAAATVTINVLASPNVPPAVEAGENQTVGLQTFNFLPGLYYGTLPGNMDSTTPNPETELITDVGAYTEDSIGENTTEVYTGQIYDFDGIISFTEKIDDKASIWINGTLVINDGTYWRRTETGNLNLTPGWNDIEIRISNGGGGNGPVGGEIGIGYDPNGGTAWQPLVDPGDGTLLRVSRTYDLAVADLDDASVTDPEHNPTYVWTDTGTGTGNGIVTFSDPTAQNPTVSFTEIGTYVLRLTANDTYDTTFDEVTITVTLAGNNLPVVDAGTNETTFIGGSNLWDPTAISTLTWHDASDTATITESGGLVSQWDDKSGNGNHMKQASSGNQPATGLRAVNGLNAIDFDGTDWLREDSNAYGATITDAFAFMVLERDRPHYYGEDFFALNTNTWFIMTWGWDNPDAMFRFRSGGNEIARRRYAPNTSGTPTLLGTYDSNTDNVRQIWVNGVNELEATSNGTTATTTGITIGAGGQTNDFNGAVAEFITLDGTVTEETRQNLEGYLSHKWGMADKLPADHPHFSVPPGAARISVLLDNATATDDDGHDLTITWSVDSKDPVDAIDPIFDDPSLLHPTATFFEPGTYVLRLTVDDGYQATPSTDTVTVTINPSSSHNLTVVSGSGDGTQFASSRVPIVADAPGSGDRFINWTTADGGFFADANSPSTTYTMPANDATVTANYGPNNQPVIDAGAAQNLGFATIPAAPVAWSSAAWTGDADSGISSSHDYTALQCFGSRNGGSVTVNGVTFPENFDSSGSGWSIGGSKTDWTGDDNAALTGESEKLGKSFIYNGNPRTVTFTGLIPGRSYEATFFGVAWEGSTTDRSQTFSVEGLAPAVINENEFGNNNGTRISCTYVATGTSQTITIDPTTSRTFHLYAMSNRSAAIPGALAYLNGSATDPDGDTLNTTWSVITKVPGTAADPVFADATQLDTTVTFSEVGTYTLQLAVNDGFGVDVLDTVVITVSAPAPFGLTVVDGTGDGTPMSGEEVEITAVAPNSTLRFVNWTTPDGGSFLDPNSATTTYTMPANAAVVTANYETNTPPVVDAGEDQTDPFTGSDGPIQMLLSPNDAIQGFQGATVGGNSADGNWPRNDIPENAIDGSVGSKYINFGRVGSGFHITLGAGHTVLTGVRITTANDASGRDPLTISIEGSNGGDLSQGSSWTLIQNNINLGIDSDPGRNQQGSLVAVAAGAEYLHYRVIVQSMRNPSDNSVQYAEIELHGYVPGSTNFNLSGSASDINADPLTTTWSIVSKDPVTAPDPLFGDASLLNSPVRFTAAGTYTLRLSANDGSDTVSDDVVITLTPPPAYALTVNSGSGDGSYLAGTEVEITADAAPTNQRFVNWTTPDGGSFEDASSATTTYTMPDNAVTLTANYEANTLPVVGAGTNQNVSISNFTPWTPAWAPSGLNLKAWYDATDASTITQDIEGVSQWNDKSGNGNHMVQTGTFDKPFSGTQFINGNNSLYFDGSDTLQQADNALGSAITEASFFKVWEMEEIRSVSFFQLDPQRFSHHISYQDRFGAAINGDPYWAGGWAGWFQPEVYDLANVPFMMSTRYSVGDNSYKNYVNGKLELQKAANGIVTTSGGTRLQNFRGKFGELIILGEAIDETNREKIGGYLAHKWGLEANLANDHPYKAAPPTEIGVVANLSGSATDPDGDPLTTTWTIVSKDPVDAADPIFGNPSSPNTTVTFTEEGTYVLRLTSTDGNGAPVTDDVTITVGPPVTYPLTVTGGTGDGSFEAGFTVDVTAQVPEGDRFVNWTTSDGGSIGDANSINTTYTMPANSAELTANFELNTLPVVEAGDNQTVSFTALIPWTPAYATPLAWYDASDASTLWADNGVTQATTTVQRWDDKSGNDKHAVAGGGQPTYNSGSSSIVGNSSTPMTLPNDLYATATSGCVVWVGTQNSGGSGWGNYGVNTNIHAPWTDNYMYDAFLSSGRPRASTQTPGMLGKQTMQSRVQTGTNLQMYSDGSQIYNGAQTFRNTSLETKFFDWGSGYTLNEVVFLPNDDVDTREKVEGYLAHKWGLEDSLPAGHPYKASAPEGAGTIVTLNGSAVDADGDPLTTNWTIANKIPGTAADPIITDASQPVTTVAFPEEGTYTLQLTANDGYALGSDQVTIIVGSVSSYDNWVADTEGNFANAFTDTAPASNPDGDWMTNLMEFALGTDPTVSDGGPLAINGSKHGAPILMDAGGGNFELYFIRRKDHGTSGSVNYTPQFSTDLAGFTDNLAAPTVVTDSTLDAANYEVVKLPFPVGTKFGRVEVESAP